jgi:hypothetical protein
LNVRESIYMEWGTKGSCWEIASDPCEEFQKFCDSIHSLQKNRRQPIKVSDEHHAIMQNYISSTHFSYPTKYIQDQLFLPSSLCANYCTVEVTVQIFKCSTTTETSLVIVLFKLANLFE